MRACESVELTQTPVEVSGRVVKTSSKQSCTAVVARF